MGEAARIAANPCRITRCRMLARIIIVFYRHHYHDHRHQHHIELSPPSSLHSLSFSIYLTRSSQSLSLSLSLILSLLLPTYLACFASLLIAPVVISLFAPKHQFCFSDHRSHCPLPPPCICSHIRVLTRTLGPNATLTRFLLLLTLALSLSLTENFPNARSTPFDQPRPRSLPLTRARARPFVPYEKDCKPLTQ